MLFQIVICNHRSYKHIQKMTGPEANRFLSTGYHVTIPGGLVNYA
jgi:hypothetical protein